MKNKIISMKEASTISYNIHRIEFHLGHPIPGGMVSTDEIKDHLLTSKEAWTIAYNIHKIERQHKCYNRTTAANSSKPTGLKRELICFGIAIVTLILLSCIIECVIPLFVQ